MTEHANPDRPLATFALFAYNQEQYVREAIEGAFAQTYEPLEIILSDDCSRDRTFEIMQEMAAAYEGPHRLIVRRNDINQGLADHVNQLIEIASGQFLVLAAGDDISKKHRVAKAAAELVTDEQLTSVETGYVEINAASEETDRIECPMDQDLDLGAYMARKTKRLVGATRTYRLATLRAFPPLAADCPSEDTTLLLRCLLAGTERIVGEPSIFRRVHGANLSAKDRLHLLPLEPLRDQYLADAAHMHRLGCISQAQYSRVVNWAMREYFLRKSLQHLARGEGLLMIGWNTLRADAPWLTKLRVFRLLVIKSFAQGGGR